VERDGVGGGEITVAGPLCSGLTTTGAGVAAGGVGGGTGGTGGKGGAAAGAGWTAAGAGSGFVWFTPSPGGAGGGPLTRFSSAAGPGRSSAGTGGADADGEDGVGDFTGSAPVVPAFRAGSGGSRRAHAEQCVASSAFSAAQKGQKRISERDRTR
jgi:hypothetical protein